MEFSPQIIVIPWVEKLSPFLNFDKMPWNFLTVSVWHHSTLESQEWIGFPYSIGVYLHSSGWALGRYRGSLIIYGLGWQSTGGGEKIWTWSIFFNVLKTQFFMCILGIFHSLVKGGQKISDASRRREGRKILDAFLGVAKNFRLLINSDSLGAK